ncbi:MAG: hypothetical protein ABH952_01005 [Candidatus Omnitrophota bacterium]
MDSRDDHTGLVHFKPLPSRYLVLLQIYHSLCLFNDAVDYFEQNIKSNEDNPDETVAQNIARDILADIREQNIYPREKLQWLIERSFSSDPVTAKIITRILMQDVVGRLYDTHLPQEKQIVTRIIAQIFEYRRRMEEGKDLNQHLNRFGLDTEEKLNARAERLAQAEVINRPISLDAEKVFVFSRGTIGGDVNLTSIVLQKITETMPQAKIVFLGDLHRLGSLFAGIKNISFVDFPYRRTETLANQIADSLKAVNILETNGYEPGMPVIDLSGHGLIHGMMPVCNEEDHYYFPMVAPKGKSLGEEINEQSNRVFDALGATYSKLHIADEELSAVAGFYDKLPRGKKVITMAFGVGGDYTKAVSEEFEQEVVSGVIDRGSLAILNGGFGEVEEARTVQLIEAIREKGHKIYIVIDELRTETKKILQENGLNFYVVKDTIAEVEIPDDVELIVHFGKISTCTVLIANSACFIGYDSMTQHLAAASRVPEVIVYAGCETERFPELWRPYTDSEVEQVFYSVKDHKPFMGEDEAAHRVLEHSLSQIIRTECDKKKEEGIIQIGPENFTRRKTEIDSISYELQYHAAKADTVARAAQRDKDAGKEDCPFCSEEVRKRQRITTLPLSSGRKWDVWVNYQPNMRYLILLLPLDNQGKPIHREQEATKEDIEDILEIKAILPDFDVFINPEGGGNTVSHIHFQAYHRPTNFPIDTPLQLDEKEIEKRGTDGKIEINSVNGWPVECLLFTGGERKELAAVVDKARAIVRQEGMSYNLLLTSRGLYFTRRTKETQPLWQMKGAQEVFLLKIIVDSSRIMLLSEEELREELSALYAVIGCRGEDALNNFAAQLLGNNENEAKIASENEGDDHIVINERTYRIKAASQKLSVNFAIDVATGKEVAIKFYRPEDVSNAQRIKESLTVDDFSNIAMIIDTDEEQGITVMEKVEGLFVYEYIDAHGNNCLDKLLILIGLVEQILNTEKILIEKARIWHQDLDAFSMNVIVKESGVAKVFDFGSANDILSTRINSPYCTNLAFFYGGILNNYLIMAAMPFLGENRGNLVYPYIFDTSNKQELMRRNFAELPMGVVDEIISIMQKSKGASEEKYNTLQEMLEDLAILKEKVKQKLNTADSLSFDTTIIREGVLEEVALVEQAI